MQRPHLQQFHYINLSGGYQITRSVPSRLEQRQQVLVRLLATSIVKLLFWRQWLDPDRSIEAKPFMISLSDIPPNAEELEGM